MAAGAESAHAVLRTQRAGRVRGALQSSGPGLRALGSGLGARALRRPVGGRLWVVLWPGGWVGLAGGAACRLGRDRLGEWWGVRKGRMPWAPPAAHKAELGGSEVSPPPCPRAPAQSREQQVKPEASARPSPSFPLPSPWPSFALRLCTPPPSPSRPLSAPCPQWLWVLGPPLHEPQLSVVIVTSQRDSPVEPSPPP